MIGFWVTSEAAEIDDASNPSRPCGSSEDFCQLTVACAKISRTERMHEVEGDIAPRKGVLQGSFVSDINFTSFHFRDLRKAPSERDHIVVCGREGE